MQFLAPFLLSMVSSLAHRVLSSLGIGLLSYVAIKSLMTSVTAAIVSNYGAMTGLPLALSNLAGFGDGFGILISALTIRASLTAIKKFVPK